MIKVEKAFFDRATKKSFSPGDVTNDFSAEREKEICALGVAKMAETKAKPKTVSKPKTEHAQKQETIHAKKGSTQVKGKTIRVTERKKTKK